jgi:tRNA-dihydrouridine synthase B
MMFPKLKNPFVLAPMADVSMLPFRLLCRRYGASLAYTEQINAIAVLQNSPKTLRMAQTCPEDKPLALQLSGCSAQHIIDAAHKFSDYTFLDINMGCPSKKIVALGYGAALLKEKEKLKELMTKVVGAMEVPVTVKMRSGFKHNEAPAIAKTLEKAGVSAITIHARTQEQRYRGSADWNTIKSVKEAVDIPVIGNGDITSPERAYDMLEKTGCDYVMIGRTAIKNPAIFKQCLDFKKGSYQEPDKIKMLQEYVALCKRYEYSFSNIKMIALNFLKGEEGGAKIRNMVSRLKTAEELIEVFNKFVASKKDA